VCFYHIIKSSFGWKSRFGCTSPILRKIGGASRIGVGVFLVVSSAFCYDGSYFGYAILDCLPV
jgi:hypothetical protein